MKTLYIHIGTEKTATTSIQLFCKRNRSRLFDHDLFYPRTITEENNNAHFSLVASLLKSLDPESVVEFASDNFKSFDEEWSYLIKQINDNPTKDVLISAEHFSSRLKLKHIEKIKHYLRANLKTHKIKIVINFRPHQELLVSAYSTMLKSGGKISFNEFFKSIPEKRYYFDYVSIAKNWCECFGVENIIVDTFDIEFKSNGLISRFLKNIDCTNIDVNEQDYRLNESLSPLTLVYGYKLNKIYEGKPNREEFLTNFSRNTESVSGGILSLEQISLIDVCYRGDVQELRRLFGKERIRFKPISWNKIKNQSYIYDTSECDLLSIVSKCGL